jgi:geranylgeranyl pyrophosphate synthase
MVHTASLILDDLPSMDDARARRGRPACHVAHGEATAILAAFALLNRAYEILAEGWPDGPDAGVRCELARDLARAVGLDGMIAGQSEDLRLTDRAIDFQTLEFIHSRKTGALHLRGRLGARARASAGGDGGRDRLRQEPRPGLPDRGRPDRRDGKRRRRAKTSART